MTTETDDAKLTEQDHAQTPGSPKLLSLEEQGLNLASRMRSTYGARFESARRHRCRSTSSIWTVTALSMWVFTASAYMIVYAKGGLPDLSNLLSLMNIVMSAFIIAFSALEHGKKHDLKAEFFLRCSQDIQVIRDSLMLEVNNASLTIDKLKQHTKEYNEIVHDFTENHNELDFMIHRINTNKYKRKWPFKLFYRFMFWLDCWSISIMAAIIPPIAFLFLYPVN